MLGRCEIHAEFLDTTEGVWFANFNPVRHVSLEPILPVGATCAGSLRPIRLDDMIVEIKSSSEIRIDVEVLTR